LHVILLLETSNYKVKRELLKGQEHGAGGLFGSGDPLVFTPSGLLVAVYDESLYVWEPNKGKRIGVWGRELSRVVFSADHRVALAKRKDGKYESFDLGDGHSLGVFDGNPEGTLLALDADRLYLASLTEKSLVLRNLKTGEESLLGAIESKRLTGTAISRDGRLLAAAAEDGPLSLWDVPTKKKIGERAGDAKSIFKPVFSPDNSLVLYSGGKQLHIWSPSSNSHDMFNPQHAFAIGEVMFSDAATLVTLGILMDPQVKIWNFSAATSASDKR
jgi:WD40 repeat protein